MITIFIGHSSRTVKDFTPTWLREQIEQRRKDGLIASVRVEIRTDCANLVLATPGATIQGAGGRPPNLAEKEILDLWDKRGLNDSGFGIGQLIAFLNQIKSWC
jgi:hypothetical protein